MHSEKDNIINEDEKFDASLFTPKEILCNKSSYNKAILSDLKIAEDRENMQAYIGPPANNISSTFYKTKI